MQLNSAREAKAELLDGLVAGADADRGPVAVRRDAVPGMQVAPAGRPAVGLAVGLVPRRRGFGVAVRAVSTQSLRVPAVEQVLGRLGQDVDVRVVGRLRALGGSTSAGSAGSAGSAESAGLTYAGSAGSAGTTRPGAGSTTGPPGGGLLLPAAAPLALDREVLRPGASIAHVAVSAGTLGCLVRRTGSSSVCVLSNSHVLADSGRARLGDAVLSPGPADGGRPDQDRVATLVFVEPLLDTVNQLDLALAELDDPAKPADNEVVGGALSGSVDDPLDGLAVAKVGRTTGYTTGTVTAVELDGVLVDYGRAELLRFDDCLEIESPEGPFSEGGDSGSVIYRREDRAGVGLLFAGSSLGGMGGHGLTYANRLDLALARAGATIV